ncbi:DNA repair and recombination protein RadA [Candidatus Woesearchaeota archaeon]|nr:DNA repair and recombination protein RadA [Candidatus Woesearchaeota archaeon]
MSKRKDINNLIGTDEEEEELEVAIPNDDYEDLRSKSEEFALSDLAGVGPATAEKLESSGFDSLMAIAVATPSEIVDATGITENAARKLIKDAREKLDMGFESGVDVLKKREKVVKITTGSSTFDEMLGGGFETSSITECFGEFGSGKTQVGHLLAVRTQLLDPNAITVYVDAENTFRPERIIEFANGAGLNPDTVLKNIKVAKAYNSDHQMLLIDKVEELITKQKLNIKLLVVDSLTAHFRAEFVGRGSLAERQQKLNKHMHSLQKIADMYNVCVYVTNQVMSKPDQFFGDPTQAIGGHIVGHASTFRIYLRKGRKGSRVAKLIDSPNLPETECNFFVEKEGIRDA